MNKAAPEWMSLDNAGKIFPGQNTDKWSNTFRVAVELKQEVDPTLLKKALDTTLERIPGFRVRIRKGAFWHYFEANPNSCPVRSDVGNFCYRINYKEDKGFLFRVFYRNKTISLDIYHALCDGYGATVFLTTLTAEYLHLKGEAVSYNAIALDTSEAPREEELCDAYRKYADSDMKYSYLDDWVYHCRGTKLPKHRANFTMGTMAFSQLHAVSKGYGVTVTELLAGLLLDIHYRKMLQTEKTPKKVSVQIPVNLRKAFPTESLRNFVLCLRAQLDPRKEEYSFEEVLSCVSTQLRGVNKPEILNSMMTKNLKMEKQVARFMPLPLKNFAIGMGFKVTAEKSTSTLISNLGPVNMPEELKNQVERFMFYTGPGIVNGARCGVASLGDKLCFTFSNCYKEGDIEKEFFKRLTAMGVDVTVETNRKAEAVVWADYFSVAENGFYSEELYQADKAEKTVIEKDDGVSRSERLRRVFHL